MKIYNTLTRKKEKLTGKTIGIYVCGPTVYDESHIGHARSAYIFDFMVRYLKFKGFKVKFVRNVTDVDDKIIERAKNEPGPEALADKVKKIADRYLKRYHEDMELLGILMPDKEPRATETIPDMVKFIKVLIKKGFAYESSGSVYFDVRKYKDYGRLSGQAIDEMEEGIRTSLDKNKKDPLDFALWKGAKEGEPSWESPWGRGRPGWHIECSVMSTKFLGKNFTIHGGGIDLVFPHHENEIAQTVCAGKKSAKYWIHNGLLAINGRKMSKSLGNFISIKEFPGNPDLLKLFFLSSHYRHPVDYTEAKIGEMEAKRDRLLAFLQKADAVGKKDRKTSVRKNKYGNIFTVCMNDDFNTPLALGAIFQCVSDGNKLLEKNVLSGKEKKALGVLSDFVRRVSKDIFGLALEYKEKNACIDTLVLEREKARKNKNFEKADSLRNELEKQGIIVEDTKEGPVWRKKA
ncbi:MAG: cysteine--tRNA ligase [Omnitrophica bacterium]|nr:cysteine--tRNA ligase [Candidatus Omnitrophota bacterium]